MQVVVLDNGCMCCTVRGDLLGAFASVLAKMDEARARGGGGGVVDSVLVETTGMADPVPIVRTLLQVRCLERQNRTYSVVVVLFSFCLFGVAEVPGPGQMQRLWWCWSELQWSIVFSLARLVSFFTALIAPLPVPCDAHDNDCLAETFRLMKPKNERCCMLSSVLVLLAPGSV